MTSLNYTDIYDWETRLILGERKNEIEFWLNVSKQYKGNILELGAGTGWFTLPLIRSGRDVWALDNSSSALEILISKAKSLPNGGELHICQDDIRTFDLDLKFALCLLSYSTFQYMLTQYDQNICLESIIDHLDNDGIIFFDLDNDVLHSPSEISSTQLYSEFDHEIKAKITMNTSWISDPVQAVRRWKDEYLIEFLDGRTAGITNETALKAVTVQEMRALLAGHGFKIINIYGDYDLQHYEEHSPRMIIIAGRSNI